MNNPLTFQQEIRSMNNAELEATYQWFFERSKTNTKLLGPTQEIASEINSRVSALKQKYEDDNK